MSRAENRIGFFSRSATRPIMVKSMDQSVRISVPVSPKAAAALGDEDKLREAGRLVSALVVRAPVAGRELSADKDFVDVLLQTRADAAVSGLNDAEVDAELTEWKRERPSRRR